MKKIKLEEVLDVRRGTSLSGKYYSTSGKYIRLTLGNFNYPNGGFKENISKDDIYFIGSVKPEYILKKGDIITPLTEQVKGLLGETAIIPEDDKYIQSGDIGLILPDESKIEKKFTYYLISSGNVKNQLGAGAQQTKIRHTSPDKIKKCEVYLPKLEQQKKIGKILFDIDAKIHINTHINNNLEEMMKTLYQRWFLEFEFPNDEGKPYKSSGGKMVWNEELKQEIPEKWSSNVIKSLCDVISGYPFSKESYDNNGKYKLITIKNVQNEGINLNTDNNINDIPENLPEYCILKPLNILMSLTGNVGRVGIMFSSNCLLNQRVAILKEKNKNQIPFIYSMLKSDFIRKKLENMSTGTSQLNLSPIETEKLKIPYSEEVINNYSRMTFPYILKIEKILEENKSLTELRDYLLPMLMNGQINVDDVEI